MVLFTLSFLPLLAFYAYLGFGKQATYKQAILPLLGAYIVYAGGSMFMDTGIDWWWYLVQGFSGVALFFLAVALMGKVTSADAVLSIVAAIMIAPLLWPVLIVFVGGVLLAATVALMKWNRSQETKMTLRGAAFQSLLSLGIGMRVPPDLEGVPRAADYSSELRVITSRWFLVVALIVAVAYVGAGVILG